MTKAKKIDTPTEPTGRYAVGDHCLLTSESNGLRQVPVEIAEIEPDEMYRVRYTGPMSILDYPHIRDTVPTLQWSVDDLQAVVS